MAQEWTHALILRLASEFQGFCRDLHNDVSKAVAWALAASDEDIRLLILVGLTTDRALNRSSADPQTLAKDFARFRITLWADLKRRHPRSAPGWEESLRLLHAARNGVVHDDLDKLAHVQAEGWEMDITSVVRWRNQLDEAVTALHDVVIAAMAELFGDIRWESGDGRG
ncbi:MAG TPA: hypothetical protein VLL08_08045 [Kineosporiaceae bacterium]|nr:hypothetical protein [Kineosporiaceae bacterium]